MNQVLVWSIVALILIALVFYLVTVESDAELDPLRQEGGIRGFIKSFKNGLHRPPAPEPVDTDLTGFLASGTEAGPAYVEADRVAARITHHTKTGYQLVRNTMNPFIGESAEFAPEDAAPIRTKRVPDIPSEPVRPLPGSLKSRFTFPKRAVDVADETPDEAVETGDDLFDEPTVRPFVEFDDSLAVGDLAVVDDESTTVVESVATDDSAALDEGEVELVVAAEPAVDHQEPVLIAEDGDAVALAEESGLVAAGVAESVEN